MCKELQRSLRTIVVSWMSSVVMLLRVQRYRIHRIYLLFLDVFIILLLVVFYYLVSTKVLYILLFRMFSSTRLTLDYFT